MWTMRCQSLRSLSFFCRGAFVEWKTKWCLCMAARCWDVCKFAWVFGLSCSWGRSAYTHRTVMISCVSSTLLIVSTDHCFCGIRSNSMPTRWAQSQRPAHSKDRCARWREKRAGKLRKKVSLPQSPALPSLLCYFPNVRSINNKTDELFNLNQTNRDFKVKVQGFLNMQNDHRNDWQMSH